MSTRTKKFIPSFDTRMDTVKKNYGVDLTVRGNMKFGNYLKRTGYPSLAKMLQE